MSGDKGVDTKLEDILKSIRGIIDNHNQSVKTESNGSDFVEEDPILELTSVISSDKNYFTKDEDKSFISMEAKRKTEVERKEKVIGRKDAKATRLINIIREKNLEIGKLASSVESYQSYSWMLSTNVSNLTSRITQWQNYYNQESSGVDQPEGDSPNAGEVLVNDYN